MKGLWRQCLAEMAGTFILVLFGTGAVYAAAICGAHQGLWQVAVVWGVGVTLAIYGTGAISGAHLNPAVTLAFAAFRKFPPSRIAPYVAAQLAGAFLAAALLYGLYGGALADFMARHGLTRGGPGCERAAMVFGEYFPNPAMVGGAFTSVEDVSLAGAMLAEGVGTALLAMLIFAVTDRHNPARPGGGFAPVMIGLAVAIIISIIAPLTQAGLNPARDFGPRLFSWLIGWGNAAIPGPRGGFFTVYILAPILGAIVGAAGYELVLHPAMRQQSDPGRTLEKGHS
ncbi:MAG: MIP/aquaporin family protein [Phycisphaerae bacterium]